MAIDDTNSKAGQAMDRKERWEKRNACQLQGCDGESLMAILDRRLFSAASNSEILTIVTFNFFPAGINLALNSSSISIIDIFDRDAFF